MFSSFLSRQGLQSFYVRSRTDNLRSYGFPHGRQLIHRMRYISPAVYQMLRTYNKRNLYLCNPLFVLPEIPTQENNPSELFFFDQLQCGIDLILILSHMLDKKGIFLSADLFFHYPHHRREKWIINLLYQNRNGFRIGPFQIPRTVIRPKFDSSTVFKIIFLVSGLISG